MAGRLVWVESFSRQRVGQVLWKVPPPACGSLQMSTTSPPALSWAEEDVKSQPGQESKFPQGSQEGIFIIYEPDLS